jgi:hypothetical protein
VARSGVPSWLIWSLLLHLSKDLKDQEWDPLLFD